MCVVICSILNEVIFVKSKKNIKVRSFNEDAISSFGPTD